MLHLGCVLCVCVFPKGAHFLKQRARGLVSSLSSCALIALEVNTARNSELGFLSLICTLLTWKMGKRDEKTTCKH